MPATPLTYAELHCHSCFSLLDGAASPEALIARAAALGLSALALTDRHDLGGIVRFAEAGRERSMAAIVGAEVDVDAQHRAPMVLLAASPAGYGNLCTLITRARMDAPRGEPAVTLELLACHADGLIALTGGPRGLVPSRLAAGDTDGARAHAARLRDIFGDRLVIECWDHGLPEEREVVSGLLHLARHLGVPWIVSNEVLYLERRDRRVHDVLTALRHQLPLDQMGTRLRPNDEWYLKSPAELQARWRHAPQGLAATLAVAERCRFRLEELRPSLPDFPLPPGVSADEYLARLVAHGAEERLAGAISEAHRTQLAHELGIIARLGLAGFFLIVWDIVRFAARNGILCQGRGSAANSVVCYCLGITAVDPVRMTLLFERFLSEGRREPPDIDLDIAHRERERVIQYVYHRYGREHAAMVCEQVTWRGRSAVRDTARALGFTVEQAGALAAFSDRFSARATADALRGGTQGVRAFGRSDVQEHPESLESPERLNTPTPERPSHAERRNPVTSMVGSTDGTSILVKAGLDPADPRVALLPDLVEGLHQLPRHRSIHVGGFILTREPLSQVVPIEPASMPGRTVIQWEKDDLDPVGLIKIDLLGLGMLTLLQDCLLYIRRTRGVSLTLASLPPDDPAVYDDLCRADTIGLFQVESRAQQNTLPRMQPRCFYDLVVEVALIRPGPIQGDMVHPYLRRRAGEEEVTYLHPLLEPVLRRTLGIPLFQEQGMQVAITAAGFTPAQADELRRAMGHKRSRERMARVTSDLVQGMGRNGIDADVAQRICQQVNAFADYGFPESHAASFALLVYASAYLRHYYAPEYTAAILNAQPMGFYSPGTLVEDAQRHGVQVLPVDVTRSGWDAGLEGVVSRESGVVREGRMGDTHDSRLTTHDSRLPTHDSPEGRIGDTPDSRLTTHDSRLPTPDSPEGRMRDTHDSRLTTPDSRLSPDSRLPPTVRLGLRSIRGLGGAVRARFEAAWSGGPFTSIADLVQRTRLDRGSLRALAEAGALDALVPHEPVERRRRTALWEVLAAERGTAGPLVSTTHDSRPRTHSRLPTHDSRLTTPNSRLTTPVSRLTTLPPMTAYELTEADYRMTALSLNGHPMAHLRAELRRLGVVRAMDLGRKGGEGGEGRRDGNGTTVLVAGLVICRQRPGTAKGFVFLTLEDETGHVNVVVAPKRYERQAVLIARSPLLLVRGTLQVEGSVVNVRGKEFQVLDAPLGAEHARRHDFH